MKLSEKDYLAHYGILRKSGRYPWGSGKTQDARNKMFIDTVDDLRKSGMKDSEIAKMHGLTLNELRRSRTIAVNQRRQERVNQINRLSEKGWGPTAIGERLGLSESTVRSIQAKANQEKLDILKETADMLKRQVEEKEFVDVGAQVERALPLSDNPSALIGISSSKFNTALQMLKEEGYSVHPVKVRQLGTGEMTRYKVLTKPGVTQKDVFLNRDKIQLISEKSEDGGRTYTGLRRPTSMSSKKVQIEWGPEGAKKDGLIEIRPGAKDLDMGKSRYAQVRIGVDGTHYMKGMAVYNPDLPKGVDVRYNTNKPKSSNKYDAMKPMEKKPDGSIDLDAPFTAQIKPGGQRGHLNIINEEGDWDTHSKNLPSQMLSKQDVKLAKTQLDLTQERRTRELNSVLELTNPAVRRTLLRSFADETDSSAAHLKAAALHRQSTKVLVPIPSMKPTEVYAPSLRNGERVALVRFPHGGTFEIPEVTVNNKNPEARKILGTSSTDVIGIHHHVAERLSGADFDGDDVLVIPNQRGLVQHRPALEGLKGFDPRASHPPYDGMTTIDGGKWDAEKKETVFSGKGPRPARKGQEMGYVSNLITDMTILGAPDDEIARAVRHSMVVIDSEKHALDYQGSKRDNGIAQLHRKYQGKATGGAKTLISRAGGRVDLPHRKPRPAKEGGPIDRKTGKKVFVETDRTFVDRQGNVRKSTFKARRLAVTEDAHELVSEPSGTPMERLYANHANRLKGMANQARKEMVNTKSTPQSKSAKKVYAKEVDSLNAKLDVALKNAPLERKAQVLGNAIAAQKRRARPDMDDDEWRKVQRNALAEARLRTGAKKKRVEVTQDEWNAIQAGAISNHKLEEILKNSDLDSIRKKATPREHLLMTSAKSARAKAMLAQGFTQAEVADQLGVALSTLKLSLADGGE